MPEVSCTSCGERVVLNCKIKIIISIFVILIITLLIGLWYFYPSRIFERKFGFKLPDTAEVRKSSYSIFDDMLFIKIEFKQKDYIKVLADLDKFYDDSPYSIDIDDIPSIHYACSWWDINEADIVKKYGTFKNGKWGAKTTVINSYIMQNPDGSYYLYCVY